MTFNEWYEQNAKYMDPADMVAWCESAFKAGSLAMKERAARVCVDIALKPSNVILGVATDCAAAIRALGGDDD